MAVERTFVDTNILVYAYDQNAGVRHVAAVRILTELWEARAGVLSVQVCQEFTVNVIRKLKPPLSPGRVAEVIRTYGAWPIHRPDLDDVLAGIALAEESQLSFWDALVVRSAAQMGATRLYTEDLNHGQVISGVRIVNPFMEAGGPLPR